MRTRRNLPVAALGVALALALTGCNGAADDPTGDTTEAGGCEVTASGEGSDSVEVTGEADALEVSFPEPLTAETTERTEVEEGEGDPAAEGSSLTVDILGFNGTSGDAIEALTAQDQPIQLQEGIVPGLVAALQCSTAGSRVAAVIPPDDFASDGREQLGLADDDAIVLVIDVAEVSEPVEPLERADGEDQPLPDGFPAVGVELAEDGAPTITVPEGDAPAELQIADLKVGDGPEVADGDNVTVHYTGVVWATGEVFDSSWERGEPASFPTDGVVSGFRQALVGHTVGSQVVAVIPPAEGYGEQGSPQAGIGPTDTLVFVVDILATQ